MIPVGCSLGLLTDIPALSLPQDKTDIDRIILAPSLKLSMAIWLTLVNQTEGKVCHFHGETFNCQCLSSTFPFKCISRSFEYNSQLVVIFFPGNIWICLQIAFIAIIGCEGVLFLTPNLWRPWMLLIILHSNEDNNHRNIQPQMSAALRWRNLVWVESLSSWTAEWPGRASLLCWWVLTTNLSEEHTFVVLSDWQMQDACHPSINF